MVGPACFPSCTKTGGSQTVLRWTLQKSVFGVQLKLNMNMNSGATVQLIVSTACENQSFIIQDNNAPVSRALFDLGPTISLHLSQPLTFSVNKNVRLEVT